MKKCSKCKKSKPEEHFNFKNKAINLKQKSCKECTREEVRKHYYANREYYLEKSHKRNKANRKKVQTFILSYLLSHPCIDCGEKDPIVLEFDHIENKEKSISSLLKNAYGLNRVKKEIEKCEIRCANCHRRKTAKDFNWYKLNNTHP